MKKSLSFIILTFFILQAASAQDKNKPAFKRFGFRAGANYSHINFAKGNPPPTFPIETSWGTGINVGFLISVPVTGRLSIQPEYLFSQMNGEIKSSETVYHFNYLSMPVFFKYQVHKKFSVLAGPQFDILISAKKKVKGSSTNITHDTEERSLAATAGIEYQITDCFSLFARYMHGFNHIGIGQRSDIQEFKYEMAQLTACVRF
ncbi:MAG: PorT family protein [Ferruginibacter sp.]|nr:PorT family protein [Ferruginibacter sp.]